MLPSSGLQRWSGAVSNCTKDRVGSGYSGAGRKTEMLFVTKAFYTNSCPDPYLKGLAAHLVSISDWSGLLLLSLTTLL